ncbi:hypothetical protein F4810DRAFT_711986 [Camillea tinctor]|nr:hypothetical protein F4810DRAFT_711986 [Camillea tinctor]
MSASSSRTGQEELRAAADRLVAAVAEFEGHSVPDGGDTDKAQTALMAANGSFGSGVSLMPYLWTAVQFRIGGVIVSMGVLQQVGEDQVAHTPRSIIFTKDNPVGLVYPMARTSDALMRCAPAAATPAYTA